MDDKRSTFDSEPTGATAIRGVALDLDGLLYDTEPLYWQVGQQLLMRRGHHFTDQLQRQMMGRPGVQAMQVLIDALHLPDSPTALLEESESLYAGILETGLQPMPGLQHLQQRLLARRLPFGVATSSRRRFADLILQRDGLADRLSFLITGDDVNLGKPDPEIYLMAAAQLGILTHQMLVLEDSENGCAAALAAGAVTVAIPGQHSSDHDFTGVHLVATSLRDPRLYELLGFLPHA